MKKYLLTLLIPFFIVGAMFGIAAADHDDGCDHGNSNTECRPDPQPDRGKDCDPHGKPGVGGGENEDHCGPSSEPTPNPSEPPATNPPSVSDDPPTPGACRLRRIICSGENEKLAETGLGGESLLVVFLIAVVLIAVGTRFRGPRV